MNQDVKALWIPALRSGDYVQGMKLALILLAFSAHAQIVGFVDRADCNSIEGWAADRGKPNVAVTVTYSRDGIYGFVVANGMRSDVGAYLKDNGAHGFKAELPAGLNGAVKVTVTVNGVPLSGGNVSLACAVVPPPAGARPLPIPPVKVTPAT